MSAETVVAPIPDAAAPPCDPCISRELSWIDFNERVLAEAANPRERLLERVKFLSIFASNLDEFLMVRVSGLKQQIAACATEVLPGGHTPAEELAAIRQALEPAISQSQRLLAEELSPKLAEAGIRLVDYRLLHKPERHALRAYFDEMVFPVCTPLGVDTGHPFPLISNLSLNLAVLLEDPDDGLRFARIKVPNVLPRLVPVPPASEEDGTLTFTWLEQLMEAHLGRFFPGLRILAIYPFRVIRDAEIAIQKLEAADLLETMEAGIHSRRRNSVVALLVNPEMSEQVRALLEEHLPITSEDVWTVEGPLGLSDLMELYQIDRPTLKDSPFVPRVPPALDGASDIFSAIQKSDIFLHHPYESFGPVVDFIEDAAADPNVLCIKQTLYRVGKKSPIVAALRQAALSGKQVAAMVELKARFDEENNIEWARRLEQAGVHVTYGLPDLKTHCKLALVVRKEGAHMRRYAHIGTGNYNATTARLYTDFGLLTCDPELTEDISEVFNVITGYSKQRDFSGLLVAPVSLRHGIRHRIEREAAQHQRSGRGHLLFKMNSLVDPALIESLYAASQAGVQIDLLIRGMCSLRPGVPGLSETIRVISVVGRFLEHSRAYYFQNGGHPELFIGSADLMPRNLDHRVEVLAPVRSAAIRRTIVDEIFAVYLRDTLQAWDLQPDGTYVRREPGRDAPPLSAQTSLMMHAAEADHAASTIRLRRRKH
jgi:polyphosphate kinase